MPDVPNSDLKKNLCREIHDPRVWRVTELVSQSLTQSVAELAAQVHLSPSRLSRIFKDEAGIGLGQYLTLLRMRHAADLLGTSDEPIKRIAAMVGYNHPSSFVRAFQEHFSESPLSYRRKTRRASSPKFLKLEDLTPHAEGSTFDAPVAGPEASTSDSQAS